MAIQLPNDPLVTVVPHLFTPPINESRAVFLEGARLLVFLAAIIRFFFGSVVFYEDTYAKADADRLYPQKNYAIDFLFGFVHFLFFFAWALSIEAHRPLRLFPGLMAFILLYDALWFIACRSYDTLRRIKLWTFVNTATVLIALVCYLGTRSFGYPTTIAQEVAFIPVIIVSAIDIAEIITKRKLFAKWIGLLIDLEEKQALPPDNQTPQTLNPTANQ